MTSPFRSDPVLSVFTSRSRVEIEPFLFFRYDLLNYISVPVQIITLHNGHPYTTGHCNSYSFIKGDCTLI